jgi:hypothetical protein
MSSGEFQLDYLLKRMEGVVSSKWIITSHILRHRTITIRFVTAGQVHRVNQQNDSRILQSKSKFFGPP